MSSFKAGTLTGYDSLTTTEYNELNKSSAKFLIENNIPFEAVNSKSLKAFLKLLRPAYNVPDSHMTLKYEDMPYAINSTLLTGAKLEFKKKKFILFSDLNITIIVIGFH